MSLGDKLREILADTYDVLGEMATIRYNHDNAIAHIKQAFKDEGWINLQVKEGDIITVNGETHLLNVDGTITKVVRMTGQAWYDRFEKEAKGLKDTRENQGGQYDPAVIRNFAVDQVIEVAKRASNLGDIDASVSK